MTKSAVQVVVLAAGKGHADEVGDAESASPREREADAGAGSGDGPNSRSGLDHGRIRAYGRYCPVCLQDDASVAFVAQEPQLGTAHALMQALPLLEGATGDVLLLYGDVPLLSADDGGGLAGTSPRRWGRRDGPDGRARTAVRLRPHPAARRRHRRHCRGARCHARRAGHQGGQRRHLRAGARAAGRGDGRPGSAKRAGRVLPARSGWHLSPARPGRLDAHGALGRRDSRRQQSPRARGGVTSRAQRQD